MASFHLVPNHHSKSYRHGDLPPPGSRDGYAVTVHGRIPHPITRYLSLSPGIPYLMIATPHGKGYKIVAEITRLPRRPVLPISSPEITIPLSHDYPVITTDYAIIPPGIFDNRDRVIIPSVIPRSQSSPERSIPHLIHGTFDILVVHSTMKRAIDTWVRDYPQDDYRYHTDLDRQSLLREHFPRAFAAYGKLIPGAYRADLWRAAALFHYGGMYVDIKMCSQRSLQSIIDNHDLVVCLDRLPRTIFNAIAAARPRHPYFELVIKTICHNVETRSYGNPPHPLNITGPGAWYDALEQYLGTVPSECGSYLHPDGTRYYLLRHTGPYNIYSVIEDNDTTYVHYRDHHHPVTNEMVYQATGKEHYDKLFHQRRVYH